MRGPRKEGEDQCAAHFGLVEPEQVSDADLLYGSGNVDTGGGGTMGVAHFLNAYRLTGVLLIAASISFAIGASLRS